MDNDYQRWQKWMMLAQNGDKQAYQQLLTELHVVIQRFVSKRVFKLDDIDDVVQNTLMGIHQSLNTYRPEQSFESWFYAIIRYKIADYLTKLSTDSLVRTSDDDIHQCVAPDSNLHDASDIIHNALNQLSPHERQLMIWLKIDRHSIQTVASFLNKSESATKVLSHRTFKKLTRIILNDGLKLLLFVTIFNELRIQ